jgi:regulator of sirC expression with transglutaminase-like and TPR domain
VLSERDCRTRAETQGFEWDRRTLEPAPPLLVLRRILNNLKSIYTNREDWPRVLRTSAQILVVTPGDVTEYYTQGVAWAGLGQVGRAIRALEAYLAGWPAAPNRDDVLDALIELRKRRDQAN